MTRYFSRLKFLFIIQLHNIANVCNFLSRHQQSYYSRDIIIFLGIIRSPVYYNNCTFCELSKSKVLLHKSKWLYITKGIFSFNNCSIRIAFVLLKKIGVHNLILTNMFCSFFFTKQYTQLFVCKAYQKRLNFWSFVVLQNFKISTCDCR